MERSDEQKHSRKEAMKELRVARKETIDAATRRMKEHRKTIDAMKRNLEAGGKTVPELAGEVGISTSEAMWLVATLKKYGEIAEGEKDGSYFRYQLVGAGADSTPASSDEG